jgi:polyisoprenoid-binding protein YceI
MKNAILIFLVTVFATQYVDAQKLITKTAFVKFYSHTPVEDIEAENNQVLSVINTDEGTLAFSMLMKSFSFEKALMQEHFNEKYVESDKFPKATFKGAIQNANDAVDFTKDGSYEVDVAGVMNVHGVEKQVESKGTVDVKGGDIRLASTFFASPEDFDISIPGVVAEKIAEKIEITVKADFQK